MSSKFRMRPHETRGSSMMHNDNGDTTASNNAWAQRDIHSSRHVSSSRWKTCHWILVLASANIWLAVLPTMQQQNERDSYFNFWVVYLLPQQQQQQQPPGTSSLHLENWDHPEADRHLLLVTPISNETTAVSTTNDPQCTSPERSVPWPFHGDVVSRTSGNEPRITCGLDPFSSSSSQPLLSIFLRDSLLPRLESYVRECPDMVVYGVAFGDSFVNLLRKQQRKSESNEQIQRHGKCFFMFVLQPEDSPQPPEDSPQPQEEQPLSMVQHLWMVPIPRHVLPYQNHRRNTKLFKYHGHLLFPSVKHLIWQDAKFFRPMYIQKQPTNYFSWINRYSHACLTVMTLPVHTNTFGSHIHERQDNADHYQPQYLHHCETILESLEKRPDVTDSAESLMQQCLNYVQQVNQQKSSSSSSSGMLSLDETLIDSAFLIWNYSEEHCRPFNQELQCTLSDQIQCHSDRDQVSFPYAMALMGLQQVDRESTNKYKDASRIDQRQNDVKLVLHQQLNRDKADHNVMVHMVKSSCHWYFRSLDDCTADIDRPSIAYLMAGSSSRFQLTSLAQNVLYPLVQQNYIVDVFAMLSQEAGSAYRQDDGYMKHVVAPETFFRTQRRQAAVKSKDAVRAIREIVEKTGASLQGIEVRKHLLPLNSTDLGERRLKAKKQYPKQDEDLRFPTLDLRTNARRRTAIGNRNMLHLFYALQHLWDNYLLPHEHSIGKPYDYVMIVRDDALWLDQLNLTKVLRSNPNADAYVQSCDARNPPMLKQEINDHGIIIRRQKAHFLGRYFSSLLTADLDNCHESVRDAVGEERGCNSEMILNWILQKNAIEVQGVPQSLLPFERALSVRWSDGKVLNCLHKYCQSQDSPLEAVEDIPICKNLKF